MGKSALLITDQTTGEQNTYIPFAERYQEFLNRYSPDDGYRVKIDTSDYLQQNPGLKCLYEKAIEAGRNPTEVGLPPIMAITIFRASLYKDDSLIQTATAAKQLVSYKDWEVGETAARQRLIAAMGFASDFYLDDEIADLVAQGISVEGANPSPVTAVPDVPPTPPASEAPATPEKPVANNSNVPAQLLKKIQHEAALQKKTVPEFQNHDDAKGFYKELLQAKKAPKS
jgi:hypothetical protein